MPAALTPTAWPLIQGASAILMITMGVRQSAGLFVLPLYADFVAEARFDKVGAFQFSFEPGTTSEPLGDPVPAEVKEERYQRLMELQQGISLQVNQSWRGNFMQHTGLPPSASIVVYPVKLPKAPGQPKGEG